MGTTDIDYGVDEIQPRKAQQDTKTRLSSTAIGAYKATDGTPETLKTDIQ